jgi:hypothetical protein
MLLVLLRFTPRHRHHPRPRKDASTRSRPPCRAAPCSASSSPSRTAASPIRNGAADHLGLSGIASRDYDGAKEALWAQKVVNDTSVEIVVNGAEAIVRRKFGKNAQSFRAQKFTGIDLRIDLPPGIDVDFDTTRARSTWPAISATSTSTCAPAKWRSASPAPRPRAQRLLPHRRSPHPPRQRDRHARRLFPGKTHFFNAAGTRDT